MKFKLDNIPKVDWGPTHGLFFLLQGKL